MSSSHHDITLLLQESASGNRIAANDLFALVYEELRRMAGRQLDRESPDHTLQSTALVHEVWLRLIGDRKNVDWNDRNHFFATAATAMRRILVDSARSRQRLKRGGKNAKVQLRDDDLVSIPDDELLALDEALEMLRETDETKAKLVELRYFAGLTNAEASRQLGISTATAERYWVFAKAWLRNKMDVD